MENASLRLALRALFALCDHVWVTGNRVNESAISVETSRGSIEVAGRAVLT